MANININDIARIASVSRATVSRVLNNNPEVKNETRQRVLSVIKELNYVPSAAARTLVSKKTNLIGVLVSNVTDIFWGRVIKGIDASILGTEFKPIYVNSRNREDEFVNRLNYKESLRLLAQQRVDGIIIAITHQLDQEDVDFLIDRSIPFVVIQNMYEDERISFVNIDNFKGAYDAAKYLIDMNHKNIVHVTGNLESKIAVQRLLGFEKSLADHGIPVNRESVLQGNFRLDDGYWRTKQILSWNQKHTAVFFGNDLMAFGGVQAIKECNKRIPEDLSIIGFDGIVQELEFSNMMFPITTMHQPTRMMGERAGRILLDKISGFNTEPVHEFFNVDLVDNGSCRDMR